MALAQTMQLKPAKSKAHCLLDRSFLLVERYDRLIDKQGRLQRVRKEYSPRSRAALRHAFDGGLSNADAQDGDANRQKISALIEQRCALTIRRLTNPVAENNAVAEPPV
jgi:hypothetical protein